MTLNLPSNVRAALYATITIATPVVAYLGTQGRLDDFYVGLYSVVVSAVTALAFGNVDAGK